MKQRGLIFSGAATVAAAAWFIFQALAFHSLTGHWFAKTIDEPLENPLAVASLSDAGIVLTNRQLVSLPDISRVPVDLQALVDAVGDGVEVDAEGEVWGRLKIHRWCGNDPVRKHIARVNLSDLILAHQALQPDRKSRFYGDYGLDIGQYALLDGIRMDRYIDKRQASRH